MPKKVRVHELAKEFGCDLTVVLDACEDLGIGVKTHSSSMEEAQADRARRKIRSLLARGADPGPVGDTAGTATAVVEVGDLPGDPLSDTASNGRARPAAAGERVRPRARKAPTPTPVAEDRARPARRAPGTRERVAPSVRAAASKATGAAIPEPAVAATAAEAAAAPVATEAQPQAEAPAPQPATSEPAAETAAEQQTSQAPSTTPPTAPPDLPPPPIPSVLPSGGGIRSTGKESARPVVEVPAPPPRPVTQNRLGPLPPRIDGRPTPPGAPSVPPPRGAPSVPPPGLPRPPSAPPPPGGVPPIPPPPTARAGVGSKPIPPPPGRLTSRDGKPIPPPPGPRNPSTPVGRRGPGGLTRRPAGPGRPPAIGPRPGGPPSGRPGGGPRGTGHRRPPPRSRARRRRTREELQPQVIPQYAPADAPVPTGEIIVPRGSNAHELAPLLNRSAADVVKFLLQQGEMVTATQSLSDDMVELFAAELGAQVRMVDPGAEEEEKILRLLGFDDLRELAADDARPPVITVMGHVDHGKTLLLDRIRHAAVAETEAGGITQHIGAYQVDRNGDLLTFLDTPGHEAFTAMRARGAEATDIVVLVVAADDGVMPQTVEAIDHARAADVPIVVAINKMDRPGADLARIHTQLAERNLVPEALGGEIVTVPVSALQSEGIDDLLDQLLLVAQLEELRSTSDGRAMGLVVESRLDKGRGPVASVLVQQGTLRPGDPVVAGAAWGRVRIIVDEAGETVAEARPSTPVQVLGLSEVARAGDLFVVVSDEKLAREAAETRDHYQRQADLARRPGTATTGSRLEDVFKHIRQGETATLNLILKADVHGSLEAVTDSLRGLERDDVKLSFVSRGVGGINENDVNLAAASNASIIGFNVRPDRNSRSLAESQGVEVRLYELIYRLIEDVQNAMLGMLAPEFEEVVTGEAQVRKVFRISGVGPVAGCVVEQGTVSAGAKVRFLRDGTIIWKGAVKSLRHFKDDVAQVNAGMECGIGLSDFTDLKEGDVIETYTEREIARVA